MLKFIIELEDEPVRLDVFCASKVAHSRSKVAMMIKEGQIKVNDLIAKPSYVIQSDDVITIDKYEPEPMQIEPVKMDLDIVYEDEDVIVINKPTGLVVHPGAGTTQPTLVSGLLYHTNHLSQSDDPVRPGIVHRIDKDTSGLLVVAKNDVAHAFLAQQLKDKTMNRLYKVIVEGKFPHLKAKVDAPIGRNPKNRQAMAVVAENSKEAVTNLTLLDTFGEYSLLECSLMTGRTHQIRVHCQYIGYPVVGDPLYGLKKRASVTGQYLHAYKLQFVHPTTKQLMTFEVDVPDYFQQFIDEASR